MLRWKRSTDPQEEPEDGGSSSLEFVTVGLVLLVPLVYLILAVAAFQGASMAVEGAARQAARVFVQADDLDNAREAAERAVEFALADHGLSFDSAVIEITCEPEGVQCLDRGSVVEVSVQVQAPLPFVPPMILGDVPLAVTIESSSSMPVSRFGAETG